VDAGIGVEGVEGGLSVGGLDDAVPEAAEDEPEEVTQALFVVDDEVRCMINERATTLQLRKRAREMGMRTMREDGIRKVLSGMTTAEEVISVTMGDKE
jgi:hypothetical protein